MSFPQLRSKVLNQLTSATAVVAYTLAATAGSYTVTGTAATLKTSYVLPADSGTVSVTGTAANLLEGYNLSASAGAYTWTGTDANFAIVLPVDSGAYVLTGTAATLTYNSLSADLSVTYKWVRPYPRAFQPELFGKRKFGFVNVYSVQADAGVYNWVGTEANLTATTLQNLNQRDRKARTWPRHFAPSPWGHLTTVRSLNRIGSTAVSYAFNADAGSYTVTGTSATLLEGHRLTATSGTVDWSVFSASLNRGWTIAATPGTIDLTAPTVNFAIVMPAAVGSYAVTGSFATLRYSAESTTRRRGPLARGRARVRGRR